MADLTNVIVGALVVTLIASIFIPMISENVDALENESGVYTIMTNIPALLGIAILLGVLAGAGIFEYRKKAQQGF